MPKMLVASSPVEIESKADETGLPPDLHDTALRMFHDLTNRLGQATIALSVQHEDWPNHRFYFAAEGAAVAALLDGLRARPDMLDVTHGVPTAPNATAPAALAGLYAQAQLGPCTGVLVGHENHEGYRHLLDRDPAAH